jgi:hypothetical protein
MARRKKPTQEPNIWQRLAAEHSRPPYNRAAGRIRYGEYYRLVSRPTGGIDARGNVVVGLEESHELNPLLARWIDALMTFDDREHHDAAPLIALLESDIELLPIVRDWLADLLRRYELRKRPGPSPATSYERKVLALVKVLDVLPDAWSKLANLTSQRPQLTSMIERYDFIVPAHRPRVPTYDLSDIETRLHLAAEMVHNLNPPRGKLDEAITAAAARYGLEKPALINYRSDKRGSSRRIKARNTRP